ncbi:hypothetical protein LCGC14_0424800 [marine sediment metagenome]|uniref:DUF669 domain-containing protein n=1 Tax=marine sediment metagenome TaxID=412755 RepID=A0A0F9VZ68_9ZZZZ
MASLDGFDADKHKPMASFDAIPKADYLCMATESEMVATKNGEGSFLKFTWQIMDGAHKGHLLWSRLNLDNKSTKAVEIAQRELGDICKACKVLRPKDSSELHGVPVILKVGVKKREDNGELTNVIKGYGPAQAGQQAAQPEQASTSAPAAPATADQPPWAN